MSRSPSALITASTKVLAKAAAQRSPLKHHTARYDFAALLAASPGLGPFVHATAHGALSIDFANPLAVKALNQALLAANYGIKHWNIPEGALCPPVPGRTDYLQTMADLLARCNDDAAPKAGAVTALDIGTGTSCIYPLIGHGKFGWRFVASDISVSSLAHARQILEANPPLDQRITLRHQTDANAFFKGIVLDDEWFDMSVCNPPFHDSAASAFEGTQRKWKNLGHVAPEIASLNFGGYDHELWCAGGEQAFIEGMIAESAGIPTRCFWFSSLVSKSASLPAIYAALQRVKAQAQHTLDLSRGHKQSRVVAWTFLTPVQQAAWRKLRW